MDDKPLTRLRYYRENFFQCSRCERLVHKQAFTDIYVKANSSYTPETKEFLLEQGKHGDNFRKGDSCPFDGMTVIGKNRRNRLECRGQLVRVGNVREFDEKHKVKRWK